MNEKKRALILNSSMRKTLKIKKGLPWQSPFALKESFSHFNYSLEY